MKTVLISILIFSSLCIKAQISLEHTYAGQTNLLNENGILKYAVYANGSNEVKLYNANHSLYKTVSTSASAGYNLYQVYLTSMHLFNSDDLVEFIVVFINGTNYSMKLYNENGSQLYDFGNRYYAWAHNTANGTKLICKNMTYDAGLQVYTYTDDVYSIPGTVGVELSDNYENPQLAFPNPANNQVIIPISLKNKTAVLEIFNTKGTLIDKMLISQPCNNISLDISHYENGMYIFTYENKNGKFIVNK